MYEVTNETLIKAYKPYDVVTDNDGNVGFIQEVSVNSCQEGFKNQISYAINWLVSNNNKIAWFNHNELKVHCNMFIKIAESSCHPSGRNKEWVTSLFENIRGK
jgi:hypothetical protein